MWLPFRIPWGAFEIPGAQAHPMPTKSECLGVRARQQFVRDPQVILIGSRI